MIHSRSDGKNVLLSQTTNIYWIYKMKVEKTPLFWSNVSYLIQIHKKKYNTNSLASRCHYFDFIKYIKCFKTF